MPRQLGAMTTTVAQNQVRPAFLCTLAFKSGTRYVWSGVGDLVYAGNTYKGVGNFGAIGQVTEGTDIQAYGTTVTLSGIDADLLSESMTDIQLGAAAKIFLAFLDATGAIIGVPYALFAGVVDKPTIVPSIDKISITLNLESKLTNLQRASNRRYTAADQQLYYPGDTFFNWVEILNDLALKWG